MQPTKIKLIDKELLWIKWDDESESKIKLNNLRRLCPCATCLSERENRSRNYIPIYNPGQVKVKKIQPVGSYAIGITWEDGHSTGIYEFPFLHQLSDNEINSGTS